MPSSARSRGLASVDAWVASHQRELVSTLADLVSISSVRGDAEGLRRVFAVDVLACTRCGGRLRLVATLEASAITRRILSHLGLPTEVPAPVPARAPPTVDDWVA